MKTIFYKYLTFLLLLLVVVSCSDDDATPPQATAGFVADKTTVKIGEEINFANQSAHATAFKWSFGDGTTSKDVSPKKTYAASGTYTVSLLSTGAGGSTISSMPITVLPDPQLYFIDEDLAVIGKFGLNTPDKVINVLDITDKVGLGLVYDAEHQKIYFIDYVTAGEGKVWSVNFDGTDLKAIVDGLYSPQQIALDVAGGKIYWSDDANEDGDDIGHIGRANLDGSAQENIVTLEGGLFRGIAVDTKHDQLYYYEAYDEDLYRANLDGSDATIIVPGVYGYAIEVDTEHDKIYFDDRNEKTLFRANLDGSNIEPIDDGGSAIFGITIDNTEGRLYWSGWSTGEIYQANLDGTHKSVLKTGLSGPGGIFLIK